MAETAHATGRERRRWRRYEYEEPQKGIEIPMEFVQLKDKSQETEIAFPRLITLPNRPGMIFTVPGSSLR